MKKYNLLNQKKIYRKVNARSDNKELYRKNALKFDIEYFDGAREEGYGGYSYDGRWVPVAKRIIKKWNLNAGDRLLDIGCAKGFLLEDLYRISPGLSLHGIDISTYAKSKANPIIKDSIQIFDCNNNLPYRDNSFDAVFAINTIHNLTLEKCKNAIREIERICPGKGFIQVDAYRTEAERTVFLDWMLTAKTFDTPEGWKKIFEECEYTGYYFWTIIESTCVDVEY
jgi:ubiquinone/menaquinone biosynthesis C-methylase UbiE